MNAEQIIEKIKHRIEDHSDIKNHWLQLGKMCVYECSKDIYNDVKDLITSDTIETLQAELAEAKAREKAAVEDLKDAHYQEEEDYYDCGICKYCKKRNDTDCNCLSGAGELFEWRGSEKGASE